MPTFETQGGTSPGVTILNADGTVHTAHTTVGFTEAVTGSGVYNYPHPSPGTLLEFVFDATVGGETLYASVWDDGLSTVVLDANQPHYAPATWLDLAPIQAKTDNLPASPAATGDAMTLTPAERISVASAVWAATTRTLTSFGTLVADVWNAATRSLTDKLGFSLTAEYDHAKDDVLTPLGVVDAKVDTILAEDVGADLGTDTCTITLHDASGGVVADARVYVSSDPDGLVRSDLRVTDALGQVRFDLTDGETYYLWAFSTCVDYTAINPIQFVAVAD